MTIDVAALREIAQNAELIEVGRKAIEDELIEFRDSRRFAVRGNGFSVREADGTPSAIIRFGPEMGLRIALDAIAAHLAAKAAATDPTSRVTCIYGRCEGAHLDWREWPDASAWMDEHMATMPHPARWVNTFRIDHPGLPMPGTVYRVAVLVDDEARAVRR